MSADTLVCPECGNSRFTATVATQTKYTYWVYVNYGQPWEVDVEVMDGGDIGDVGKFECTDCGEAFDSLDGDSLTTREAWVAMVDGWRENGA